MISVCAVESLFIVSDTKSEDKNKKEKEEKNKKKKWEKKKEKVKYPGSRIKIKKSKKNEEKVCTK